MSDKVIPTIHNTGCLRLGIFIDSPVPQRSIWMQFNFMLSGTFTPGTTALQWSDLYRDTWNPYLINILPRGIGIDTIGQWYQFPAATMYMPPELQNVGVGTPHLLNAADCIAIHLHSAVRNNGGSGRILWPLLFPGDLIGSRVQFLAWGFYIVRSHAHMGGVVAKIRRVSPSDIVEELSPILILRTPTPTLRGEL